MDKSFLTHVRNKDFVALGKQLHGALTSKVLENLANRKAQLARSMGVQESTEDGSAEDGAPGVGVNEEEADLKDIPESKK
jgi:hypothetical protein